MNPAVVSLLALVAVIVIGCVSRINVGVIAIALSFLIGTFLCDLKISQIVAGFPAGMFLVLIGITLFFSQARVNGTLDKAARWTVKLARGRAGIIPLTFFLLGAIIATMGPGNIGAIALLAPIGMAVAGKTGISAFLMTIMVANGAGAGALSPLAPTGLVSRELCARIGLTGVEWRIYFNVLIVHLAVAIPGYLLLGGWKLFARRRAPEGEAALNEWRQEIIEPLTREQYITLAIIVAFIASVILLRFDVGMAAFIGAALMSALGVAREEDAIRAMPWSTILMVSGMTLLAALLEKTGGMTLFTALLARVANPTTINGVVALVAGLVSAYSSSIGVVLPALLPSIPGLIAQLGGGDPLALASSINVGAHLVDVSPLSTLGALCIANAASHEDKRILFNKVLAWGLAMAPAAALACHLLFS